ncbi:hypothetical protein PVAND_011684 [Polypedilum vanderplanki]|uniref:CHK kinase-like domain-containing protein n=1 Tax=Polypedilum vanderplanki TaxID=319348 RepID=A0A9J6CK37_POLVA|nr:hypothetical protein PVAND_011684 [Polypedilum vanderplanki]
MSAVALPEFVTIEFLQRIFVKNFGSPSSQIRVENFWGGFATNKGDNYASVMYRIIVDYELNDVKRRKPIILKVMPSDGIQSLVMVKNRLYPREIHTYCELLVQVENLLKAIDDHTKFAPRCFYTATEPTMMLVFEDQKEKGYKVLQRQHQLNFDLTLPLIIKLAKLHAASAVLYEKNPSIMEPYLEGSISRNPERQDFLIHYRNCARTLGLVAENEWGQEWRHIALKLQKLEANIVEKGCELYTRKSNGFFVFNHNDLWIPNILYEFGEHELVRDVLLIDFQMPYFGSLGIDLNFLIYGSLSESTRISFAKKLIRIYHETLTGMLTILNYKGNIPTLHDIHVEVLKCGFNGLIAAIAEVPLLLMENNENLEMDLLLAKTEKAEQFRYSLFNNPRYKNFIQTLLLEFDDNGLLD